MKNYLTKLAYLFSGVAIGIIICLATHLHQIDFYGLKQRQEAIEIEVQVLSERGLVSDVTVRNMQSYMEDYGIVFKGTIWEIKPGDKIPGSK